MCKSFIRAFLLAGIVAGMSCSSAKAQTQVTVNADPPDLIPAVVDLARGMPNFVTVTVNFSEPVTSSAGVKGNYTLTAPGGTEVAITAAAYNAANPSTVTLTTAPQVEGTVYMLGVTNVADLSGNLTKGSYECLAAGIANVVTVEYYDGIGAGNSVADLQSEAIYQSHQPTLVVDTNVIESAVNRADNYGTRIVGNIIAPETGDYYFYIASDDGGQFRISTDADPANLPTAPTAEITGSVGSRAWSSTAPAKSEAVALVAGKLYYFELLHKEGGGGDNAAIAWSKPSEYGVDRVANDPPIGGADIGTVFWGKDSTLTINSQPAANITVEAKHALTLKVDATGSHPTYGNSLTYQWYRGGVAIAGATAPTYVLDPVELADNNAIITARVHVAGKAVMTTPTKLTVIADVTAPSVVSLTGSASFDTMFDTMIVKFDEYIDGSTVYNLGNYNVAGLTISSATLQPDNITVILTTSKQVEGKAYTLEVSNVADLSGNAIMVPVLKTFHAFVVAAGFLRFELYDNIPGATTSDLTSSEKFLIGTPDLVRALFSTEVPVSFPVNAFAIGTRMHGFLIPPVDGTYTFYISGYDGVELYLSPDADPANKQMIATDTDANGVQGGTGVREWTKYPTQKSEAKTLAAGQKYYLEALHKQQGGGVENFAIGWTKPGEASATINVIPGKYLASFVNPDFSASITILEQPGDAMVRENQRATFTVAATGLSAYGTNVGYQWQKNGTDIEGALDASYATPFAPLSDNGAKFKCVVKVPTQQEMSMEATLTVTPEVTRPMADFASRLDYPDHSVVTVVFSRPLAEATAANTGNYSLDGAGIASAAMWDERTVLLTTSLMVAGQTYTLTVNHVQDLAGNSVPTDTRVKLQEPLPPRVQDAGADGLIVAEAERYDRYLSRGDIYWTNTTTYPGFSGECAMQALPDNGENGGSTNLISPRLDYQVDFVQTGTLYMWIRGTAPFGGSSDSVFMGVDDNLATQTADPASGRAIDGFNYDGTYKWSRRNQLDVTTVGLHVVSVWMREDGFVADKIIFSMNPDYLPMDLGPEDTRPAPAQPARLTIAKSANGVTITWNTVSGAGFTLKNSAVLGTGSAWTPVDQPVATSGDSSSVAIPANAAQKFYRLVK